MRGGANAVHARAWAVAKPPPSSTRSCPAMRPSPLTDAMNAMYSCLPNHALRWQNVSEATPASKRTRVYC